MKIKVFFRKKICNITSSFWKNRNIGLKNFGKTEKLHQNSIGKTEKLSCRFKGVHKNYYSKTLFLSLNLLK